MVYLPPSWLTEKTTLEIALAEHSSPFIQDDWDRLLGKMQDGDEVWHFEPPTPDDIEIGRLALVRNGEVISTVILWVA